MRFTCVSASVKTEFAFFVELRYNACVSHACPHLLKGRFRFPWYGVKVRISPSFKTAFAFSLVLGHNACVFFHTHVCIGQDRFCVFLCIIFQYKRFTRLSASVATAFAFSSYRLCIIFQYKRFTRVSASVKTTFAFFFVSCYNVCVSNACLHRFRRLLRFPSYGVTIYAFHTRMCID